MKNIKNMDMLDKEDLLLQLKEYDTNYLCDEIIKKTSLPPFPMTTEKSYCYFKKQNIVAKFTPTTSVFSERNDNNKNIVMNSSYVIVSNNDWGAETWMNSDRQTINTYQPSRPSPVRSIDIELTYKGLEFLELILNFYNKDELIGANNVECDYDLSKNICCIGDFAVILSVDSNTSYADIGDNGIITSYNYYNPLTFECVSKSPDEISETKLKLAEKCLNLLLKKQHVRNGIVEKEIRWAEEEKRKKLREKYDREDSIYQEILNLEFDVD